MRTVKELDRINPRYWSQKELEFYAKTSVERAKKRQAEADKSLPKKVVSCSLRNTSGLRKRNVSIVEAPYDWSYSENDVCPECGASFVFAFGPHTKHP